MKEVEITKGETLFVSDSLVESVDLSEFYESTVTSNYFLEVSWDKQKSIFSLNEISYDSKLKSYTLELVSELGGVDCFLSDSKIHNIEIKRSGKTSLEIKSGMIKSFSFSASLVGNSSPVTVIIDLV